MYPRRLHGGSITPGALSHAVRSKLWRCDGALSRDQVAQLLGFSLWETEAFLKQRQAYLQYTEEDLARDRRVPDGATPQ
jgi:predicted HTH domain antitoxin